MGGGTGGSEGMGKSETGLKVSIIKYEVPLDPPIDVFNVVLENQNGTWHETLPSEETLRTFLRGVQAGAEMAGGVFFPNTEIPQNAEQLPEKILSKYLEHTRGRDDLPF